MLLIDLDTQRTASTILTRDITLPQQLGGSELLFTDPFCLDPLPTPAGIDVVHGHQHLEQVDHEFDTERAPEVLAALPRDHQPLHQVLLLRIAGISNGSPSW